MQAPNSHPIQSVLGVNHQALPPNRQRSQVYPIPCSIPCHTGCRQDTAAQREPGALPSPSGRLHLSQPLTPWKAGKHPHRVLGENERHREGAKQQLHSWPLVSPQMRGKVWERPQRSLWKGSSLPSEEAQGPGLFSAWLTVGGPGLGSSPAWMVNRTCPLASPATSANTYQDWLSAAWSTGLSAQPCHGLGLPFCVGWVPEPSNSQRLGAPRQGRHRRPRTKIAVR